MQRILAGIIIGLLTTSACDSPDEVAPNETAQTDTIQAESDASTTDGRNTAALNESPDRDTINSRVDESSAAGGPGVSLQTILDQAFSRDPQTGQLNLLAEARKSWKASPSPAASSKRPTA